MRLAVPQESAPGETRVALVPDMCSKWVQAGVEVLVAQDAGKASCHLDDAFAAKGARIVPKDAPLLSEADIVIKVTRPTLDEINELKEGTVLVSFLFPQESLDLVERLRERRITAFSMETVPRITRAQSMDALSSMSTLAGYKAVLVGAARQGKILPMMVTAAGTIAPAKAFILGAGVAGLQAIATARRLGAVVSAFDVRAATQEQIESLGAKFVPPDLGDEKAEGSGGYAKQLSDDSQARNLKIISDHIKEMDLVITTALIPGRPAPLLIPAAVVDEMRPGAVIVDLAAERGGNCECTRPDEEVVRNGVAILGPTNLPATIAVHASQMYSRNLSSFLQLIVQDGELKLDFEDEVLRAMCITHDGEVRHDATRELLKQRSD